MGENLYAEVDAYLDGLYGEADPVLARVLERSEAAGLPAIQVSANLGRLLHVLVLTSGARRILEIGTLGGYSAIWLARALPGDGRLISLEVDEIHAEVARANIADAGLTDRVDVRRGRALDLLGDLERDGEVFDMVFIDADKPAYPGYLEAALRLSRPGTLLVADNVVRAGAVASGPSPDEAVTGTQRYNAALAADPRLASAIVQQVGVKGHDGMAFAVVRAQGSMP